MKLLNLSFLFFIVQINFSYATDNILIHGTVMDTVPCTINNGEMIFVDFGNIGINKIDGNRYKEKLTFILQCSDGFDMPFKLVYKGDPSDFDLAAIKTSIDGLGIKLFKPCNQFSGCEVVIGDYIDVNMSESESNQMEFHIIPVKNPKKEIKEGYFYATASFYLDYY